MELQNGTKVTAQCVISLGQNLSSGQNFLTVEFFSLH